ncbi:MAE_28990/MAE_18760 family HEPN-like nuclease [Mariniflexile sp. HMF6888]|uniref:MAE_28990/MAE_18760 family HEPN-like nuclease n=1 Tax=Mariniflexile sp. HMF6888 TaxID=3373086 RepID=UPI003793AE99
MKTFVQEILADIEWRTSELATLKSIPIRYSFSPDHKDLHIKYSIPAIYSIWEGFVKNCFAIYSNHLNTLSLNRSEISYALLTHQLDSECDFNNPRVHFDKKMKLVQSLDELFQDIINIKPAVPTESNVNLKVLNRILERYCITEVDGKYNSGLNKLLLFRNKIAHGENSIIVNMTHVTEFISLVENMMLDVVIGVEICEKNETFKK